MKATGNKGLSPGIVNSLREIRDEMNHKIKDMSFEEQRAYLDKLLGLADKTITTPAEKRKRSL